MTFPADEGHEYISNIDAFIPIVNDEIDENIEQTFIVFIEIRQANNHDLILETGESRNYAICKIIDDDRKFA